LFGGVVVFIQLNLVIIPQLLIAFSADRTVAAKSTVSCKYYSKRHRYQKYPLKLFEEQNQHILKGHFFALNALMHTVLSFPCSLYLVSSSFATSRLTSSGSR